MIWCIFGLILLIISVNDFLFFRIENEFVVILLVLYVISYVCKVSGSNFLQGLTVASSVFIVTWILNQCNLIGGGDVKLLFPLLLFSENNFSSFILGTSVSGLILSLLYIFLGKRIFFFRRKIVAMLSIFYKKRKNLTLLKIALLSFTRISRRKIFLKRLITDGALKQEIPYGVALSCGGFYVIFDNLLSR